MHSCITEPTLIFMDQEVIAIFVSVITTSTSSCQCASANPLVNVVHICKYVFMAVHTAQKRVRSNTGYNIDKWNTDCDARQGFTFLPW